MYLEFRCEIYLRFKATVVLLPWMMKLEIKVAAFSSQHCGPSFAGVLLVGTIISSCARHEGRHGHGAYGSCSAWTSCPNMNLVQIYICVHSCITDPASLVSSCSTKMLLILIIVLRRLCPIQFLGKNASDCVLVLELQLMYIIMLQQQWMKSGDHGRISSNCLCWRSWIPEADQSWNQLIIICLKVN
jgi:hypothetical protein